MLVALGQGVGFELAVLDQLVDLAHAPAETAGDFVGPQEGARGAKGHQEVKRALVNGGLQLGAGFGWGLHGRGFRIASS